MTLPFSFILFPLIIILLFFAIRFTIRKAQQKVDADKHILIRIGVLLIFIPLTFLVLHLVDDRNGILGAIFISAYFIGAWILYIIVEAISLFAVKQNKLARTNLIMLFIVALIVAMVFFVLS